MTKQLVRVYLFIFFIVTLLLLLFNEIYHETIEQEIKYDIPVQALFNAITSNTPPNLKKLPLGTVEFPSELQQQLDAGEVIAVSTSNNQLLFYRQEPPFLIEYGPINNYIDQASQDNHTIQIAFYILLAIAILLILIPIAKDIMKVQIAAMKFAKEPGTIKLDIPKSSILFPIAQSLEQMSNRIVELIKIQKDLAITVAHEIRTPLSRLRFVHKQISPEISAKNNGRILKDIEEINTLASDYLTYAKINDDDAPLATEVQPLRHLSELIADKFEVYQDKFTIHINHREAMSRYDLQQMSIATQNLVMNAMRYASKHIEIDIRQNDNWSEIKVRDDGAGIGVKGGLTFIKAPRGTGKTEVIRYFETGLLSNENVKIALLHMEEMKSTTLRAMATYHLGCNVRTHEDADRNGYTLDQVEEAANKIADSENNRTIIFEMQSHDDPLSLLDYTRMAVTSFGADYVFVDHVQRLAYLSNSGVDGATSTLTTLGSRMAQLAKELNIGVVFISQVNDDGRTKYAASLEEEAIICIKIERDVESEDEILQNTTEFIVDKNRPFAKLGRAGSVYYDPETTILSEEIPYERSDMAA